MIEITEFLDDRGEIVLLRIQPNPTREIEKVRQDRAESIHFPRQCIYPVRKTTSIAAGNFEIDEILPEQLCVETDRRKWVLDLVGKPACHRSKFSEPLGMTSLTLGFACTVGCTAKQHDETLASR